MSRRIKNMPLHKRLIKKVGLVTFWVMLRVAGFLRPWSINLLGNSLGTFFYYASRRYRKVALNNLSASYKGEKTEKEIKAIAKDVFRHFTKGAFEFFYFLSLGKDQIYDMVDVEGKEHLNRALSKGKGCIIVTAHFGNWELMARWLVFEGYKVNVIARDSDDPGMTGIATYIRENGGYKVFGRDDPLIGAFKALKRNECLGILLDQNDSKGIFVDFFNRPAATAVGPALLSLRSGAPIVPAFAPRIGKNKYKAEIYPSIEYKPMGNEEEDVRNLTVLITKSIEEEIRKYPSQWLWLHDRWKSAREAGLIGN